ncbi:MAG: hypothetical protein IJR70_01375 [Eubacterium sp.]|nr:hypothetical protein [Eubacterium sp.]
MPPVVIVIIVAFVLLLGVIIFPIINRIQFKKLPFDQQIRILMKQAKGLNYFKNISYGSKGNLIYIKNKRKILSYPWVLVDGKMLCTKDDPFKFWDYPEERPQITEDEKKQAIDELEKYNEKSIIKLYLRDE